MIVRGSQARCLADCAVDVGDETAAKADDMVMIVFDVKFVACERSGWLEAPQ